MAICRLASGVQSREPIVPLPSVGMKPTNANNIVRTNEREIIKCTCNFGNFTN